MKQKILILVISTIFLVSACAPQAAPTTSALDVQHTAEAAAFTMVAQTQAAIPTNTPVPPTETASPTLPSTSTPEPTSTIDPALLTATPLPNALLPTTSAPATSAQPVAAPTQGNCNKTLSEWTGPTVNFTIMNETRPEGRVILSLYVVTESGECGYLADVTKGPAGMYSAGAFVDGRQDFKVFGGFRILPGNWKIIIRNDKITAQGGCYPNC